MKRRLRIGLTGGIASGKSAVAARFVELGVPVIDADEAARAVVAPGQPGLANVIKRFGSSVLTEGGALNRSALRNLIFADTRSRQDLEAILHPLIRAEMERREALAVGPYAVMAIPLLVEGGSLDRVDRILVIDTDESTQMHRLMARDNSSEAQARAIFSSQAGRVDRLKAADDVVENCGSVSDLRQAIDHLHEGYLRLAKAFSAG